MWSPPTKLLQQNLVLPFGGNFEGAEGPGRVLGGSCEGPGILGGRPGRVWEGSGRVLWGPGSPPLPPRLPPVKLGRTRKLTGGTLVRPGTSFLASLGPGRVVRGSWDPGGTSWEGLGGLRFGAAFLDTGELRFRETHEKPVAILVQGFGSGEQNW